MAVNVQSNSTGNAQQTPTREVCNVGQNTSASTDRSKTSYVRYLEGLRGLAALNVTLYHIWGHTLYSMPMTGIRALASDWIGAILHGRLAVDIFIVLSGYLLMRPAACSSDCKLPGGTSAYLKRRAWRILPPYYAALVLALGLELTIPSLRTPLSREWSDSLPAFGMKNIAAHFLLVHNLSFHWASKIDAPMWTVATEWQIYFVFPLLMLPVWRRLGSYASIATGLSFGLGCYFFIGGQSAAPWYLGLFAFGMAAAARDRAGRSLPHDRYLFGLLTVILSGLYALFIISVQTNLFGRYGVHGMEDMWRCYWPMDILVGAATACFVTFAAATLQGSRNPVVGALSTPWLVKVGVVSYSLYLIHDPLFALMKLPLNRLQFGPFAQMAVMVFIGLPVVMLITYGFHVLFEKPFISSGRFHGSEINLGKTPSAAIVQPLALSSLPA